MDRGINEIRDKYLVEGKNKNYKGKKFQVWQGYEGDWFWTVNDDPVTLHGQHAANEKEALAKAKERIDKKLEGSKWKASF
jgi:hypothetical protein